MKQRLWIVILIIILILTACGAKTTDLPPKNISPTSNPVTQIIPTPILVPETALPKSTPIPEITPTKVPTLEPEEKSLCESLGYLDAESLAYISETQSISGTQNSLGEILMLVDVCYVQGTNKPAKINIDNLFAYRKKYPDLVRYHVIFIVGVPKERNPEDKPEAKTEIINLPYFLFGMEGKSGWPPYVNTVAAKHLLWQGQGIDFPVDADGYPLYPFWKIFPEMATSYPIFEVEDQENIAGKKLTLEISEGVVYQSHPCRGDGCYKDYLDKDSYTQEDGYYYKGTLTETVTISGTVIYGWDACGSEWECVGSSECKYTDPALWIQSAGRYHGYYIFLEDVNDSPLKCQKKES